MSIRVRIINGKGDWTATPPTGADEADWRGLVTDFISTGGVVNLTTDLIVTQQTVPNMSVKVSKGTAYIANAD